MHIVSLKILAGLVQRYRASHPAPMRRARIANCDWCDMYELAEALHTRMLRVTYRNPLSAIRNPLIRNLQSAIRNP